MKKGFSLVETIIAIGVLLIIMVGVISVLQLSIKAAGRTGARVGATSLVNKRMEMLRNLEYDNVGTVGGIPSGLILQEEIVNLNSIDYTLKTFIQYVDDPADGLGDDDENGIATDYKRVRVEISWQGRYIAAPVVAVSDFMPKGIESVTGGGTLSISVFDAQIQPVSLANIHIVNTDIVPNIDINVQTNPQGKIVFPGSPSVGEYEITVTKEGYSTAQTYEADSSNPNPDPGHLTILEGETTDASFAIDKLAISLVIETKTFQGLDLLYVEFDMIGNKIIGEDSGGQPIYKYSQNHDSGVTARVSINNLEWDVYDMSSPMINPNLYDIAASDPPEPINVEPDTSNNLTLYLAPHAPNTLLITIKDPLITSASVRLFKSGYDETILSGFTGQAFFTPLQTGIDYSLEVIKTGYQDYLLEDVEILNQTEINIIMTEP